MKITYVSVENCKGYCITDVKRPRISFGLEGEQGANFKSATITLGDKTIETTEQLYNAWTEDLKPFTNYQVKVVATDDKGNTCEATTNFSTGRQDVKWTGKWISDGEYKFVEKKVSPVPMTFKKSFAINKEIESATLYSTAMGIYEATLNGKKVGNEYFAPGFTSYKTSLQYQTYDILPLLKGENTLRFVVAGGWAVGSFVFTRQNRVSADRQALLAEVIIKYKDGTTATIATDSTWLVSEDGNYRLADVYDGETYDATIREENMVWRTATIEKLRVKPQIVASYGERVLAHEVFKPLSATKRENGEIIYDFGQNFAGVIRAKINGKHGQTITFKHAEVLKKDGSLYTELLRSAKATATYVCKDGQQEYSPKLTYMGFRYVGVSGIDQKDIEIEALALYSNVEPIGEFECSNELINKLQSNIIWSAKSNFIDIPTDCPQRDERMGWTGDIALFAPTACFNFDMSRFLDKWLKDVRAEQLKTGGIPNTVPAQGYGFPATMPSMAIDFWGDACILVPWAEYMARGDKTLLEKSYESMKKYVKACKFWAGLFSFGKKKYIWHTPAILHFGDWVAPDEPTMAGWQKRSKWTATASLANTSATLAKIAKILGKDKDEKYYLDLSKKVADAYESILTDGNGKLINEFQTAYVLPLHYKMFKEQNVQNATNNLVRLIEDNDYCIGTGFPGTPYVLFALADNGRVDVAYKMLTNTKCPSWLYEVKVGGTTIWERWDALREDGSCNAGEDDGTGGMISFNHYASGAVGDFLYRRVAGIEPLSAGYKTHKIAPVVGGGLTYAKGSVNTPYGKIESRWDIEGENFTLKINVPLSTKCTVVLPNGTTQEVDGGKYAFTCKIEV